MEGFNIEYSEWKPKEQKLREALCTLGNGYFATRGAAEENKNNEFNYPGTYLAGGYNRAKTEVSGKMVENEDFVNFPNWLCMNFRPEEGEWLNLEKVKVLDYRQVLEMKKGVLVREFRVEDDQGRRTKIRSRRIVSMRDKHLVGIEWFFTPENWSGRTEFRSALDGTVINDNVERYRDLESQHLNALESRKINDNSILLLVETKQSKIRMAQAARTTFYFNDEPLEPVIETNEKEGAIGQVFRLEVKEGENYTIEKIAAIYTSKDRAITEPVLEVIKDIERHGRFVELLVRHEEAMQRYWHRADIVLKDGDKKQQLLRLHIFHVMQTVSFNTIGLDVGVPSRGLHGEAYRGHIFWDELYIFPFLNLRFPEITRSLLMYRYERLDEARYAAKEAGYRGAMFPWQSGSNGREESQVVHLNPKSGNWIPDDTHLQRHVNCAIAFNIWNYFLASDDQQFLSGMGAEIFLSIALFWASKVEFNKERDRYEIHGVVGPDEYHTSYPDSDEQGLKNNAYTNVMVAWLMNKAVEILELIEKTRKEELLKALEIDKDEINFWDKISREMYIPFIEDDIISQFEGYEELKEFPWEEYREKYDDIQRLDRVLESEGDSPNNYKANKQADVLMLFYLFSKDEVKTIFERLGYDFSEDLIEKNIDYYRSRTSHGSTLSRFVFSWILAKYDKKESWQNFETLLTSDFEDIQGGTTPEGIHLGAMAGSLNLIQRCYSGLEICDDALWINPDLPENIKEVSMRIKYRKHWIFVTITHEKLKIAFEEGWSKKVNIGVAGELYEFEKGEVREFSLGVKSSEEAEKE
ncbi:glycoside hydrolase family 65 protein [Marivirga sp. S37H4]|uniref:Glycoside hydrolase family 65 protein n=1 Tax=Marivirga aurantiaca TaxID=2802615 RepID=A0A935C8Q1_9BACT|nr:glycoside hydrolase family 65 protein [Marivirga aurantiaca]MBK6265569.1 glycoside hydrolase family 65 protein [Marivirga aurantiaca]